MHDTERSLPRLPRILATDEIIPTMQQMIDQHRSLIDQLVGTQDISFDTIVCPIAELENAQSGPHAIIDALKYCSPSTECQSAVEEAQKLWSEYTSRPRRGLYNLLRAVRDKGQIPDLESRRLLDQMMLESEEYGYGSHLDDAALRERAARIARIKQLEAAFNRNLRQTGGDMVLTAEQATGLPEQERKERYDLASDFVRVMTNAHNADTRRRFMEARHAQYPENVPLFREAVLLRDVNARELGAPSHAATRMPYRVAESVESVERLMDDLADRLVPYGLAERERANQLKKRQLGIQDDVEDSLDPWDLLYYSAQVDQGQAGDAAAFAEYFPLVHTLNAMVALFGDCLGLRFERIPEDRVRDWAWHESVFGWTVWDEGGGFVGHLFADIVAREYKYKGNQSVNLQPGYLRPDGTRVHPANTLMCGFDLTPETECLLRHQQVTTLFHELGHGIHDLVSRTRYAKFHGYQVPLELGEGIGIMLEQWCFLPDVLKRLSRHYTALDGRYASDWLRGHPGAEATPPETIPDALIDECLGLRAKNKIIKILGRLLPAYFDLQVHNQPSHEALVALDETQLYKDLYKKFKFVQPPEWGHAHAAEGVIMSGYDAGFYSYICAEIFAADLFQTAFAADPLSREAWQRFRSVILEPGGSKDGLSMMTEFLGGRQCEARALLDMLGVSAGG